MGLINWLLDRLSKLIALLDTYFDRLIDFAWRGVNWFLDRISDVARWAWELFVGARDWAMAQANAARDAAFRFVIETRDWLWTMLWVARDQAIGYALALYNQLLGYFGGRLDWLFGVVIQARDWLWVTLNERINWVQSFLWGVRDYAAALAFTAIEFARSTAADTLRAVETRLAEGRAELADFRREIAAILDPLTRAPATFIWTHVEPYLVDWLTWTLAVLLTREGAPTPPRPALFEGR